MKNNRTNKTVLLKGIKSMIISAFLMFVGPTLFYIAFSNKEKTLFIPILIVSIILCIGAIVFAFSGIRIILNSMFKNS